MDVQSTRGRCSQQLIVPVAISLCQWVPCNSFLAHSVAAVVVPSGDRGTAVSPSGSRPLRSSASGSQMFSKHAARRLVVFDCSFALCVTLPFPIGLRECVTQAAPLRCSGRQLPHLAVRCEVYPKLGNLLASSSHRARPEHPTAIKVRSGNCLPPRLH